MSDVTRELARRFTEECWDRSDVSVLDAIMSPDFVDHDPTPGQGTGREGYKEMAAGFFGAFSDFSVRNEDVIAEGEKAALRWTARGRHTGPLLGIPPTGREIRLRGIDIIRVHDGRIAERWGEFDLFGLLQQLGVIPAQPS